MRKLEILEKEQLVKNNKAIKEMLNSSKLNELEELRIKFKVETQDIPIATEISESIRSANIKAQQVQDEVRVIVDKIQHIIIESDTMVN